MNENHGSSSQSTQHRICSLLREADKNINKLSFIQAELEINRAIGLSKENDLRYYQAVANTMLGRCEYLKGNFEKSIALYSLANHQFRFECADDNEIAEEILENNILMIKAMVAGGDEYNVDRFTVMTNLIELPGNPIDSFFVKIRLWLINECIFGNAIDDWISHWSRLFSS